MLLIPAIDLKEGSCVRLRQGRMEENTVFSDDPLAIARKWVKAGARRLHMVDLDGAFAGKPVHFEVIHQICVALPDLDIQIGGGISNEDTIRSYLEIGVRYVIIGTKAINAPHFIGDVCSEFPGNILVSLDAKDGIAAIDGWSRLSRYIIIDIAKQFEDTGVEAIIYTDISCDGMMQGVNLKSTLNLARAVNIPVIASGGITNYNDINVLCHYENEGIIGAVVGRALYEGTIDLAEGQSLADGLFLL